PGPRELVRHARDRVARRRLLVLQLAFRRRLGGRGGALRRDLGALLRARPPVGLPDALPMVLFFRRALRWRRLVAAHAGLLSRLCSRLHSSTRAWSPERRTSGTFQPRNSAGRV